MAAAPGRPRKSRRRPALPGVETLVTVGDWLRFAVTTFSRAPLAFAQGLHGPQEEALFLVGRFLGIPQEDLPHFLPARLTSPEITELDGMIRERVFAHVPVPYLVNEASLGGLSFFVDRRVLIPRSYLAELLPGAVAEFAGRSWSPRRILDLGTGSGCLAILAAHAFPDAVVEATDVSTDALAVAGTNVASHGLEERVLLVHADVFDGLAPGGYDLILANPPYEPAALVDEQPPELDHEPRLALEGGDDGMSVVRRILREARARLVPRGVLVLELGGLRLEVLHEFPGLRHHVFALKDGTDAVIGVKARDLPRA